MNVWRHRGCKNAWSWNRGPQLGDLSVCSSQMRRFSLLNDIITAKIIAKSFERPSCQNHWTKPFHSICDGLGRNLCYWEDSPCVHRQKCQDQCGSLPKYDFKRRYSHGQLNTLVKINSFFNKIGHQRMEQKPQSRPAKSCFLDFGGKIFGRLTRRILIH